MNKKQVYHGVFNCYLLPLCILLLLAGCAGGLSILPVQPATATPLPTVAANALTDSSWQLMAMGTTTSARPVLRDSTITLEFDAAGHLNGSGGCSTYSGLYQIEETTLRFAEITGTRIACADYRITNQEEQYLNALQSAGSFALDGDQLAIWYEDHHALLTFTKASAVPPATATDVLAALDSSMLAQPVLPTMTVGPPVVASSSPPTLTTSPTASNGIPAPTTVTPITFAPGVNSTEINGSIAERSTNSYLLSGQQSQLITVIMNSPNNDVLLRVTGEDGTTLKQTEDGQFSWTSQLPATQDYLIAAVSVGPATTYTLRVTLESLSASEVERLEVAPNAPAVARSGNLAEANTKRYVLAASAGHTLTVQSVGYNGPVNFTIRSPNGSSWNGVAQGSDSKVLTAQVVLSESGDYEVELSMPAGGTTPYDLSFTLSGAAAASTPTPTVPPERVDLAPGTTTAERTGQLPDGASSKQYLLSANAGQALTIDITSVGTPLALTITSPTGTQWPAEMNPVTDGYAVNYQLPLAETGDYIVTLTKADSTPTTSYTARFTVQ